MYWIYAFQRSLLWVFHVGEDGIMIMIIRIPVHQIPWNPMKSLLEHPIKSIKSIKNIIQSPWNQLKSPVHHHSPEYLVACRHSLRCVAQVSSDSPGDAVELSLWRYPEALGPWTSRDQLFLVWVCSGPRDFPWFSQWEIHYTWGNLGICSCLLPLKQI